MSQQQTGKATARFTLPSSGQATGTSYYEEPRQWRSSFLATTYLMAQCKEDATAEGRVGERLPRVPNAVNKGCLP